MRLAVRASVRNFARCTSAKPVRALGSAPIIAALRFASATTSSSHSSATSQGREAGLSREAATPSNSASEVTQQVTVESLLNEGKVDAALDRLSGEQLDALLLAGQRRRGTAAQTSTDPATKAEAATLAGRADEAAATTSASPPIQEEDLVRRPVGTQWPRLFFRTALPFFAFGVCDNIIMLTVGDLIDEHFGVVMGFSTLIAAGLGQAVSDGSGVTIQCVIDRHADKLPIANPKVDPEYLATRSAQRLLQMFRTIGIVCGCLCGLIPVYLFDMGNKPRFYDLLLHVVPEEHRRELSATARFVHFNEGDYICRRGEPVNAIDTIVTGEVSIIGRGPDNDELHIADQGPGAGIGFLELTFNHDAVADVVCRSPVKTLRIDRSEFEARGIFEDDVFRAAFDAHLRKSDDYTPYLMTRPKSKPRCKQPDPETDTGSSSGQATKPKKPIDIVQRQLTGPTTTASL